MNIIIITDYFRKGIIYNNLCDIQAKIVVKWFI